MNKLIILLSFLFLNQSVHGFSSVIGNQSRNGKDIHARITHPVIDGLGFSYISFRALLTGIVSADYYKNLVDDASMHCDRNRHVSPNEALQNCHQKYQKLIAKAKYQVKSKKYLSSLYILGQALHVGQDLISHSNIALLPKVMQNQLVEQFVYKKNIKNEKTLKITYWDYRDNKNNKNSKENLSRTDPYNHKDFSLDHPKKNNWSKKKVKNNEKMSQYKLAYFLAKKITKKIVQHFLNDLSKEDVRIIKNYNLL